MKQTVEWISVAERLPEGGVHVLLSGGFGSQEGCYFEKHHRWLITSGSVSFKSATHWMPMPKGPAELSESTNDNE